MTSVSMLFLDGARYCFNIPLQQGMEMILVSVSSSGVQSAYF